MVTCTPLSGARRWRVLSVREVSLALVGYTGVLAAIDIVLILVIFKGDIRIN